MEKTETKKQGKDAPQPPAADQQAQTAEADAVTIRALHEMIMELGQQFAALGQRMADIEDHIVGDVLTGRVAVDVPQIKFDPAWLKGLVFTGSKEVKPEAGDNGRSVKRYQPFTRAATVDDVMSWRIDGDEVSIVLSDGTKHQVER